MLNEPIPIDYYLIKSLQETINKIHNDYTNQISYILQRSIPKIIIYNDGNFKYVYDDNIQKMINIISNECNKKIKEIINESNIGKLCNSRGITPYEF